MFSERELHSRYEVRLEQYVLTIAVEAKLALEIGSTVILPAAIRYQTELAQNVATLKAAGVEPDMTLLELVSAPIASLTKALGELKSALATHVEGAAEEALHYRDAVLPAMAAVREAADELENVVADDLWPLRPTRKCCSSCELTLTLQLFTPPLAIRVQQLQCHRRPRFQGRPGRRLSSQARPRSGSLRSAIPRHREA